MLLIQDLPESPYCFSSEFRKFTVVSDAERVGVTLTMGDVTLLDEVYYLHNGTVGIYEIDSLALSYFHSTGESVGQLGIKLTAGEQSFNTSLKLICCARLPFSEGDALTWLTSNFLTLARYRRIPRGVPMVLNLFLNEGDERAVDIFFKGTVLATGEKFEGGYRFVSQEGPMQQPGVWSLKVQEKDCYGAARYAAGCSYNSEFRIDSMEYHEGERYGCFYIDDDINDAEIFSFMNLFNLPEYIAFPGQSTAITEHSAELAVSAGTRMQYDRKTDKSYKINWPVGSVDDAPLIEDFICSPHIEKHIQLVNPGIAVPTLDAARPIVITDSKLEVTKFDTFNSAEFTYMFVNTGIVEDLLSLRERIFTKEFNQSFL